MSIVSEEEQKKNRTAKVKEVIEKLGEDMFIDSRS
jgi:hypothetical protein